MEAGVRSICNGKSCSTQSNVEHDLLSKVKIGPDFPFTDERVLILLRFRVQFRLSVGDKPMKVSPHVAAYKSSIKDVKLYAPRAYNQSNTEGYFAHVKPILRHVVC